LIEPEIVFQLVSIPPSQRWLTKCWPEARAVYEARSPLHHADRLQVPVLFLQGLEDRIVPPSQAEAMVSALDARGIPVAYVPFEGEQHGFRQAATIRRALEAELYFYGRVFDFEPAGPLEPVPIRNL
jgi:dipeptidyl aminopeptidase/acylaminoacyl peptidase